MLPGWVIGSLNLTKRFRNPFGLQAEVRINFLLSALIVGLLFHTKAWTQRKADVCAEHVGTQQRRTSADVAQEGCSYELCWCWICGLHLNWKGLLRACCVCPPALPYTSQSVQSLQRPRGNTEHRENPQRGKQTGEDMLSPPESEVHLLSWHILTDEASLTRRLWGLASAAVTETLSVSTFYGICPSHNFRMDPGAYFCLLD